MVTTYIRLVILISSYRDILELGPAAEAAKQQADKEKRARQSRKQTGDLEAQRYMAGADNDPDSPGLERFYNKNVFICEPDGRPRWCATCGNWKLDRTYHNSEIGRCVHKLDHYCPWVGGTVARSCEYSF
jgi:palmitoyltransferase